MANTKSSKVQAAERSQVMKTKVQVKATIKLTQQSAAFMAIICQASAPTTKSTKTPTQLLQNPNQPKRARWQA